MVGASSLRLHNACWTLARLHTLLPAAYTYIHTGEACTTQRCAWAARQCLQQRHPRAFAAAMVRSRRAIFGMGGGSEPTDATERIALRSMGTPRINATMRSADACPIHQRPAVLCLDASDSDGSLGRYPMAMDRQVQRVPCRACSAKSFGQGRGPLTPSGAGAGTWRPLLICAEPSSTELAAIAIATAGREGGALKLKGWVRARF